MLNRFRQFFSALTARLTPRECDFVRSWLSEKELALFFAMDRADQRHSLDVAKTCLQILEQEKGQVNLGLLLKGALLHDVGKQAGDLQLWDRVLVVLVRRLFPALFYRLAKMPCHPFHVTLNHPQIGVERCINAGCSEELVRLVGLHHTGGEGGELEILVTADRLN